MQPAERNLFDEYDWGGYLINALDPNERVYVGGRFDVYGADPVERSAALAPAGLGRREGLDQYGARGPRVASADRAPG